MDSTIERVLHIRVVEGRGLPGLDANNKSDPYWCAPLNLPRLRPVHVFGEGERHSLTDAVM